MTDPGHLSDRLRRVLEAGILAPSADNRHGFRIEVASPTRVLLWPRAAYREENAQRQILAQISLGAVAENISLEAATVGWQATCTWPGSTHEPLLAIDLTEAACQPLELARAIRVRHTNRSILYRGPALSPVRQEAVRASVADVPGIQLDWMDARDSRSQALALVRLAEAERFRLRVLHEELFESIRFDVGWRRNCDEGLPPAVLGVEAPLQPAFALLRHWSVMRVLRWLGVPAILGIRAAHIPCASAPHLGVISADGTGASSLFAAGRAFQRAWLRLTLLGMAVQPYAAAAIYALPDNDVVPGDLRHRLRTGWAPLVGSRTPVMVFRAGWATEPRAKTQRPPLECLLTGR